MSFVTDRLSAFVPSGYQLGVGILVGLSMGVAGLFVVSTLRRRGLRAPDTRKLFHAWIFSGAGLLQFALGVGAVSAFGAAVAVLVLASVRCGEGFGPFEALARPSDAPRRGLFVVVPLIMTAVGGVASSLLFPSTAMLGYWVTGWGDAVGEPVGVRWGRHQYKVPSLAGVPAKRSLEGSAAVLVVSALVGALGLGFIDPSLALPALVWKGSVIGVVAALVEALSNHGTDNLTLQVAASGVALVLV